MNKTSIIEFFCNCQSTHTKIHHGENFFDMIKLFFIDVSIIFSSVFPLNVSILCGFSLVPTILWLGVIKMVKISLTYVREKSTSFFLCAFIHGVFYTRVPVHVLANTCLYAEVRGWCEVRHLDYFSSYWRRDSQWIWKSWMWQQAAQQVPETSISTFSVLGPQMHAAMSSLLCWNYKLRSSCLWTRTSQAEPYPQTLV